MSFPESPTWPDLCYFCNLFLLPVSFQDFLFLICEPFEIRIFCHPQGLNLSFLSSQPIILLSSLGYLPSGKLWNILNLQKHCINYKTAQQNIDESLILVDVQLVNLKMMSLERVSENKKKCGIETLKYGLLQIRKKVVLGLH